MRGKCRKFEIERFIADNPKFDECKSIADISRVSGIKYCTLKNRIYVKKMSIADAVNAPTRRNNKIELDGVRGLANICASHGIEKDSVTYDIYVLGFPIKDAVERAVKKKNAPYSPPKRTYNKRHSNKGVKHVEFRGIKGINNIADEFGISVKAYYKLINEGMDRVEAIKKLIYFEPVKKPEMSPVMAMALGIKL